MYKENPPESGGFYIFSGSDLLSQAVTRQVPSALEVLTTVFEMGTGVAPPLSPPETLHSVDKSSFKAANHQIVDTVKSSTD